LAVLEFVNPAPETDIQRVDDVVAALALLVAPAIANVQLVERAHQAETRYQRLFDLNLDPVVVLDQAGRVTEANQSAHKILGVDPATADSSTLTCLGLGERAFSSLREETRQEGTVTWNYQLPDGERYFEARLSYLPEYVSEEDMYLWIGHDITDRVGIENARQKFVHMLVHDLRAPLSSVQNSLELVLTAWREKDVTMPVEQVLGIGLRSVNRMGRLISDILDSAALQDQERTLQITEITVSDLINEAVETIATSASRRDQRLVVEIASDIPVLFGDAELLRRVLINLLTNAVKFTPDQGEIHMTAKPVECAAPAETDADDRCEVHFSVTDTGPGIAPEIRENLFKLYVRTSDRRIKGTGIGLAFCKLAVEAHGGRIWFESLGPADEPDKGARFTFAIPRVPPAYVTKDAERFT
jgi:two-component system, NtrC family, sensor histidine kinase KinB